MLNRYLILIAFILSWILPTQGLNEALDKQVRERAGRLNAKVALFAKNLDTGETYGFNPDMRVRTASTIKLAIMVEAFARVAEGKARWTDEMVLTGDKKVAGAGILGEFSDGLRMTLRDAVNLMITISDNTATNLVIDALSADAVNQRMDALGLKQTRSLRKIGGGGPSKASDDPVNKGFGIGVSTQREMVALIEKIERGQVVSEVVSKEMITLLKRQQHREGIGRRMTGFDIATKPGALDSLRSDVGIFYTPHGRIAMAITVDDMPDVIWTVDNPGLLLLSDLSDLLVEGLKK